MFPRQQCLAVVQLTHEVHPGLRGFEWVHHLKTHARHPAWDIQAIEDVIGHEIGDRSAHVRRDAHGNAARVSTGEPNATTLAMSFERRYAAA